MRAAPHLQLVPLEAQPAPPEPEELILQPYRLFSECAAEAPAAISFWQGAEKKRRARCAAKLEPRRPAPKPATPEPQPYGPIQLQPLPLETWRPAHRRRAPVRATGLRLISPHVTPPRKQRPGARPKSMGLAPLTQAERLDLLANEAWLRSQGILQSRPQGEGDADCENISDPDPCPWLGCRQHLGKEIDEVTGILKLTFPDRELWELPATCAIRVARERGGISLEEVGKLTNVTEERVRQVEAGGMRKMRRRVHGRRPADG